MRRKTEIGKEAGVTERPGKRRKKKTHDLVI